MLDASEGKIAKGMGDRLMMFCYMYDPSAGAYTLQAMRVMQIAGVLTMIGLAGLIGVLLFGERLRRRALLAAAAALLVASVGVFAPGSLAHATAFGALSGTAI